MELAAVASVVVEKLKMSDEITDKMVIEEALIKMQRVIADTNEEQRNSDEFKSWAEKCLRSLYYVEDTVESFTLGIARQNRKWGFLMNHSLVPKNLMPCQKLRRKIKRIPSDIKRVIDEKPKGTGKQHVCSNGTTTYMGDQNRAMAQCSYATIPENDEEELVLEVDRKPLRLDREKQAKLMSTNKPLRCSSDRSVRLDRETEARLMYTNSYADEELEMFDIRQEVHDLVKRLTKTADKGRARIVEIAGELGSGKTTLARAVYKSRKIKDHFESGCAWVTISKEFNKSDVLQNLLKQVGDSKDSVDLTTNELETRLLECLNGKKYLIVLDDVQSEKIWEGLRSVFLDS